MELAVNTDLIVAIASGVLSIFAGIVGTRAARRTSRFEAELRRQERLEDEAHQAERIEHRYRDPLLDAAHALQSRIYNIVEQAYLQRFLHCGDPAEERYARDYTVFAVAEYLTWVEIVRRELRFLDLGDVKRNREFLHHFAETEFSFQTDKIPSPLRIFRGRQRAIAELMMTPTAAQEGPKFECIGYATFCRRLDTEPEFAEWFQRLRYEDIDTIASGGPHADTRLVQLQHNLIDLIDFLDQERVRIRPDRRRKIGEGQSFQAPGQRSATTG